MGEAIEHALGLSHRRPARIGFDHIVEIDPQVKTDLTISETAADAVEQKARAWVKRIPGSL